MKRSSPFRVIATVSLLATFYTPSLDAMSCRNFISDIICSTLASEQAINAQLANIESLTDQVLAQLPEIFSDIDELNSIDVGIINTLNSILPILIQDTAQLESLLDTSAVMLNESSYILSVNENIDATTLATCSINELINSNLNLVINENNLILSFLDPINTQLSILDGHVATFTTVCSPTPIFGPTTITAAGSYCVAKNIANGQIQIAVSNVTLNLNGHSVAQGSGTAILINSNLANIVITNGVVNNSATGILVNSNCSAINLSNLQIRSCGTGINFNSITDSVITLCSSNNNSSSGAGLLITSCKNVIVQDGDFSKNLPSGVVIQNSQKITVNNTTANANTDYGFSLVSSQACVISGCKAFSNGASNSSSSSFGFISTNGSGNIFESCIADGTTSLNTAVGNSVAGFALVGTENCSKILGCESANAFAPYQLVVSPGIGNVTAIGPVPYGILLQSSLILNNNSIPISNPTGLSQPRQLSLHLSWLATPILLLPMQAVITFLLLRFLFYMYRQLLHQ